MHEPFNVADIAIFAGAFGLVLFTRETKPEPEKPKGAQKRKPAGGKANGSGRPGGGKTP